MSELVTGPDVSTAHASADPWNPLEPMADDVGSPVVADPAPAIHGNRRLIRRLGWNLADQVISSLTNLSLSLVVARSVGADAFGAFSVAFIVFQVGILITRAVVGQPLSMRFAAAKPAVFRPAASGGAAATLLIALLLGAGCCVVGMLFPGELGRSLIIMGAGLPGLLLQDTWRMIFFAQLRPARAAANDFFWMVLQIMLVAVVLVAHGKNVTVFVAIWSGTAAAAALLGIWQSSCYPSLRSSWRFLCDHWDTTRFLLAEQVTVQGSYQGVLLVIGALGGLVDVGALRGALVLLGPVGIIAVSITAFGIPELSRRKDLSRAGHTIAAAAVSLFMTAASASWVGLFLLLPNSVGHALLGGTWPAARAVLVPMMVYQLGLCVCDGPTLVLYALGRTRESFHLHAVFAVMLVAGALVGLELGGAPGAALGMGIAACALAPVWWYVLAVVLRDHPKGGAEVVAEAGA